MTLADEINEELSENIENKKIKIIKNALTKDLSGLELLSIEAILKLMEPSSQADRMSKLVTVRVKNGEGGSRGKR